jgi:RNA polymerase sigma-70 factor, ECF subfamily
VTPTRTNSDADVVALVRRHQTEVWRYLRYLGASAELADDLTQETFLTLLRRPPEQRSDAETGGWLRTVARHLYVKAFRKPPLSVHDPDELEAIESAWRDFAGDDAGDAKLVRLRGCLESLSPRAREAVQLHYEERRSRREIGARFGIGEDGVKSLLRRTRTQLYECMQRREGTEGSS